MPNKKPIYARVLLKLSGESLLSETGFGVGVSALNTVVKNIKELTALGVEVAVVIGGGNFLRGADFSQTGFDRVTADQMGMLFTVANGLALRTELKNAGANVSLLSSIGIPGIANQYSREAAVADIEAGKVLILTCGTGEPLFSTDSAASLRAVEINADVILKASTVDGVYSADPKKDASATKFDRLHYQDVIENNLQVMDMSAICLCNEHDMPIRVFDMNKPSVLKNILLGDSEGTLIGN